MSVTESADTRGMHDTAPNMGQARPVARSDSAQEAATEVLFGVLDQVAKAGGPEAEDAKAHLQNMRERGQIVFPEDLPGERNVDATRETVRQQDAPARQAPRPSGDTAAEAATETVMSLMADTGLVTRTPHGTAVEEQEATATEQVVDAPFSLDFTAPEDLADELDQDDDDVDGVATSTLDELDVDEEYDDPRVVEAVRRAKAAEKKAQHYESLRLAEGKKAWVAEAKERLAPLVLPEQLEAIEATSRRDFWRQAKQIHEQNAKVVAPLLGNVLGTAKADAEAIRAQARAEAEQAWGRPTVGAPGAHGAPSAAQRNLEDQIERERRRGNFQRYITLKFRQGGGV